MAAQLQMQRAEEGRVSSGCLSAGTRRLRLTPLFQLNVTVDMDADTEQPRTPPGPSQRLLEHIPNGTGPGLQPHKASRHPMKYHS